MKGKLIIASAVSLFLCGVSSPSHASNFVVTLTEVGSNVVATGGGQLDLTGLVLQSNDTTFWNPGVGADGEFGVGVLGSGVSSYYLPDPSYPGTASLFSFFGPTSFANTPSYISASSASGTAVGMANPDVSVPLGYQSDAPLSLGTTTWANSTFASLGITPGTYTWTWGSGADQSFTIDASTSPVPIPAAVWLFGSGLVGLIGIARRSGDRI